MVFRLQFFSFPFSLGFHAYYYRPPFIDEAPWELLCNSTMNQDNCFCSSFEVARLVDSENEGEKIDHNRLSFSPGFELLKDWSLINHYLKEYELFVFLLEPPNYKYALSTEK